MFLLTRFVLCVFNFYLFNFNVDINRAEQTAGQGDINPEPSLDQSPFPGFLSLSLSLSLSLYFFELLSWLLQYIHDLGFFFFLFF